MHAVSGLAFSEIIEAEDLTLFVFAEGD